MTDKTQLTDDQIADVIRKRQKRAAMIPEPDAKPPSKKRGSKSASIEATTTATNEEIASMIGSVLHWYNREPVKTDQECADRLNEYFQHISMTGEIPTVEKMAMALGVTRETLWSWKTGVTQSKTRSNMIKKAYDVLAALDAELVSRGKIPQVTYIFRAKNFFEMSDTQQIVVTPNNPLDSADPETARQKYLQALPEIIEDN